MKKYELLDHDVITLECKTVLFRVKALREIAHPVLGIVAAKGQLGGYVYAKEGLSDTGNAWVTEQAQIIQGRVEGDALLSGYARLFGGIVKDYAIVAGNGIVAEHAVVMDEARVLHDAKALGHSIIRGSSTLAQQSIAQDNANLLDATLLNTAKASVNAIIEGATIKGDYVVQHESVISIDKGIDPYPRYGCNYHSDRYEHERSQFKKEKSALIQKLGHVFHSLLGKKYKLLKTDTITLSNGVIVYRIKALKNIAEHGVKRGDLGGYVQSEYNLSHLQGAWVGGNAIAHDEAVVAGCALITDSAKVMERATLTHQCTVRGSAIVHGNANVMNMAVVGENATVNENALICGYAMIKGHATVSGDAQIHDKTIVDGEARIDRIGQLRGNSHATNNAQVSTLMPRNSKIKEPIFQGSFM